MKRLLFVALSVVCLAGIALAKRLAPKEVPPVVQGDIVYSAPSRRMGVVVATSTKTGKELWSKQIYTIQINSHRERDVQDCHITSLCFKNEKLMITNEYGQQFELDPNTQEVVIRKPTPK